MPLLFEYGLQRKRQTSAPIDRFPHYLPSMLGFPWSKQSVTLVKGAVSQKKNRGPVHETNNLSVSEVVKQKVPSLSAQKGGYKPHFLISQYVVSSSSVSRST